MLTGGDVDDRKQEGRRGVASVVLVRVWIGCWVNSTGCAAGQLFFSGFLFKLFIVQSGENRIIQANIVI